MGIFRAYDIRGIYGKDLTDRIAEHIGKAFATFVNTDEIVVGRDCRLSSPQLSKALCRGMLKTGADVLDTGLAPFPATFFYANKNRKGASIGVTASHNPPEYNGFKTYRGKLPLSPAEIQELPRIINGENFLIGNGKRTEVEILDDYCAAMENEFEPQNLKVVIDCSNGTTGLTAPRIFKNLGFNVTAIFIEPDGNFPNHPPDPTKPEALRDLKEKVLKQKADVGIIFDGDGDRVGLVDEKGHALLGEEILMLIARAQLEKRKGKVIFDITCSQAVADDIKSHGGEPVIEHTGHSFIHTRLFQDNAVLAGEYSGHLFFNHKYFVDDAVFAALHMLELMKEKPLSQLRTYLPRYFSSKSESVPCPEEKKNQVMERIKCAFSDYETNTLDGVRIQFENGWALVRPSNTEPVLRIRCEAKTEPGLEKIKKIVHSKLREAL